MTLGQRIQELRKGAGLSQEALGEALGVSRQAVSKWESDGGIPELDTLIAMSRLFGITLGQLLGVETPEEEAEEMPSTGEPGFSEAQVEEILRRYVQESRPPRAGVEKWVWLPVLGVVLAGVLVVLFSRISSLQGTVRQLQNNMINLENRVSENLSGLYSSLRGTILDVLEEENRPISSFDYEVTEFDLAAGSVELQLSAVLKTYTPGETQVQYLLKWEGESGSGTATTEWIAGTEWTGVITIPMNDATEVTVRIRESGGQIREYETGESIYGLGADNFNLWAANLHTPIAVTIRKMGIVSETSRAENACILIYSRWPEKIWPEKAEMTVEVNGEKTMEETLLLTQGAEESGFEASLADTYFAVELSEGDTLRVALTVTDNLGRTQTFEEECSVVDGRLEQQAIAIPADTVR